MSRFDYGRRPCTAMTGIAEWADSPNISDLFPWLSGLDLQGLRKTMDRDKGKALEIASGFVKQRIIERKKDILDASLDFEGVGPPKLLEENINIFIYTGSIYLQLYHFLYASPVLKFHSNLLLILE